MINFYSKTDCSPCDFYKGVLSRRFDKSEYVIHEFETDNEVLEKISSFGYSKVPLIEFHGKIIVGDELRDFVFGGSEKSKTFKPIEIVT